MRPVCTPIFYFSRNAGSSLLGVDNPTESVPPSSRGSRDSRDSRDGGAQKGGFGGVESRKKARNGRYRAGFRSCRSRLAFQGFFLLLREGLVTLWQFGPRAVVPVADAVAVANPYAADSSLFRF